MRLRCDSVIDDIFMSATLFWRPFLCWLQKICLWHFPAYWWDSNRSTIRMCVKLTLSTYDPMGHSYVRLPISCKSLFSSKYRKSRLKDNHYLWRIKPFITWFFQPGSLTNFLFKYCSNLKDSYQSLTTTPKV